MPALRSSTKTLILKDNFNLHGGRVRDFAIEHGLSIDQVIDFSSNVSPFGPPKVVQHALDIEMARIDRYPDAEETAEQVLADYVNVKTCNVLLGNGSAHLIYLLVSHFRPKNVIVFSPTFFEYERAALSIGAKVIHLPLKSDFSLNINDYLYELREADMVFICNPNNPSGNLITADEIMSLKRIALKAQIIVDEAFMDFLDDDLSVISHAISDRRLIVLRSMGKFFSLAGLRVGYMVAEKGIVAEVGRGNPPWMVSNLAIAATVAAVADSEFISFSKKEMSILRDDLMSDLDGIRRLHVYPSRANFVLIKSTESGWDSKKIQRHLAKEAILIREADDFVYLDESHFRIAIKNREDNKRLSNALKGALK